MGSCNPLLPPFPPLLPPGLGGSPAPGGGGPEFARNNPNRSSLSGGGTPPSERERGGGGGGGGHGGSAHSTPSSEFSSQQNWSFEEQFKQVSGNRAYATFKSFGGPSWDMISLHIHSYFFFIRRFRRKGCRQYITHSFKVTNRTLEISKRKELLLVQSKK